jgi:hypothetical protein
LATKKERAQQHLNLENHRVKGLEKHPHPRPTMHNNKTFPSINGHKTWKTGTNKGNNKADTKYQFSNNLRAHFELLLERLVDRSLVLKGENAL